ncbi:hypothetical protein D3C78_1270620 [compost metagenome]
MLSMPPASTTEELPAASWSCASMIAFMPEPHILLMVVAPIELGMPAAMAACLAGACPCPAESTQPISTSSISAGEIAARSTAARIAAAPRSGAATDLNSPWNPPIAVRAAPTITTGSCTAKFTSLGHPPTKRTTVIVISSRPRLT